MKSPHFDYRFKTTWKVKSNIEDVWAIIYDQENWPAWWKGVVAVTTQKKGNELDMGKIMQYTWKSILPYTLSFYMVATEIKKPYTLAGNAFGELDGMGRWELIQEGDHTTLNYYWHVNANKPWMKKLSWLLKPAFKWNHDIVMNWGARGLAKKLNTELVLSENIFEK